MFKRISVLALCSALVSPIALRAETLADALVMAYKESGLIDQNRALLRAADEDVAQAVSQLRPIVNWTAQFSQEYGRTKVGATVPDLQASAASGALVSRKVYDKTKLTGTSANLSMSATLLLTDFGKTRAQIESTKETVLATRQDLLNIEQQVMLRATFAYLDVIRARKVVDLRKNNVRVLEEELRATMDRFDVGEVTRTDIAQSEARLAEAQGNLSVAQGELEVASAEYKAVVGRMPGKLVELKSRPEVKGGEPEAMKVAMVKSPQLESIRHAVAAADFNIDVAEAQTKPTVSLYGEGTIRNSVDDKSYLHGGEFGVKATGPIYQGGNLASVRRKAINLRDAQLGQLHYQTNETQRGVRQAYAQLAAAIAQEKASKERVRAQEVAFNGVREEARLGERTTLDVLNSEQELLDARVVLVSATIDVFKASYAVLKEIGEMTVKELRLNTPTYDPTVYYNRAKNAPVRPSPQGQQLERILRSIGKE